MPATGGTELLGRELVGMEMQEYRAQSGRSYQEHQDT